MAKAKKNATTYHRSSPEQIEAVKAAIIAGETAKAIHEKFGTSIENIHYHKAQLRKKGLLSTSPKKSTAFPKTAKAVKTKTAPVAPAKRGKKKAVVPAPAKKIKAASKAVAAAPTNTKNPLKFTINGVAVQVSNKAKHVQVKKSVILIEF